MRWSKIKNIIILLLVIVNLALLGLVGFRAWRAGQNERLARERMIAVLENNNIAFLPGQVPADLDLDLLRLTVTPPDADQAAILVGEVTSVETVGARTVYTGTLGSVSCSASGEMEARYSAPSLDEPAALGLLDSLGVQWQEDDREDQGDGRSVLTLSQLCRGVPVPGETVTLTFRAGQLESLTLRRLDGTWETVTQSGPAVTASTALLRFLEAMNREGYVCSQVTALYPGYLVSGSDTVTFTPAWYVETDTRPWRFAVDGLSGAVTAAE